MEKVLAASFLAAFTQERDGESSNLTGATKSDRQERLPQQVGAFLLRSFTQALHYKLFRERGQEPARFGATLFIQK